MEWDDEGLDDGSGSPLLPPDDRLWRHPSEVVAPDPVPAPTSVRGSSARPSTPGRTPRVVTIVALTSCISVLLTLGVVAIVRPFRVTAGDDAVPTTLTGSLASVGDVAELTARLRGAIGQVRAVGAGRDGSDAMGSGVILRSDGMMLTAHHVVDGASALRVLLDDGRQLAATLVGADPDTDLALLDLEGDSFPTVTLASTVTEVGRAAMTIGATPSSSPSSTPGPLVRVSMVSAVGQEAAVEGRRLVDMIRTDSAIASGCSGGALVDSSGRVIGIAASNADAGGGDGIVGYATPGHVAKVVAEELMATGRVVRGWLGIEGETGEGAVVRGVQPASPAAAAGLVTGDVIVAIDGAAVASMSALVSRLRSHRPGDEVRLTVRRGDETTPMRATLGEKPSP